MAQNWVACKWFNLAVHDASDVRRKDRPGDESLPFNTLLQGN